MESRTYIKNIRTSPKKLRFLLPAIKKMNPAQALDYLNYTPRKTAKIFYKALQSAIINAKATLKSSEDMLKFKLLTVEAGQKMKRFRAGGRGTAKPIVRRLSHIKIILMNQASPEVVVPRKKLVTHTVKKQGSKSSRTNK